MDQTRNGHHANKNMFELLNDLQSARLNDQRTNMPRNTTINSYPPPPSPLTPTAQHSSHHNQHQSTHQPHLNNFDHLNQGKILVFNEFTVHNRPENLKKSRQKTREIK